MVNLLSIQVSPLSLVLEPFLTFIGKQQIVSLFKETGKKYAQRGAESKHCRQQSLPPIEEMFLSLLRLHLGLLE